MNQNQTIIQSDPSRAVRPGHISDVTVGSDFLLGDIMYKHGLSKHPVYGLFSRIRDRCYNPNHHKYKIYGGRGIIVCDEWKDNPNAFIDWAVSHGWEKGLCIDRINVNGNYEPNNCRFIEKRLSNLNTRLLRSNNISGYRGVCFDKHAKQYRARLGINRKQIHLGHFKNPMDAAIAYDSMAVVLDDGRPTNFKWPI